MTSTTAPAAPFEQVLEQIHRESGHEDLSGLTADDLKVLARELWDWAEGIAAGEQAVALRD